jgi:hypothetical protein
MKIFLIISWFIFFFGCLETAWAEGPPKSDSTNDRLNELEAQVEILKRTNRLLIGEVIPNYRNTWVLEYDNSVMKPYRSDFTYNADLGIGGGIGLGYYIGKVHYLSAILDWDLYPSIVTKYTLDLHFRTPLINIGPIVGYKQRLINLPPLDNFVDKREVLPAGYFVFGIRAHFPIMKNSIFVEIERWEADKKWMVLKVGFLMFNVL